MLTQVERLGRLVKQLLDLSRLESGAVPLERTAFRVEPLLAHAVREQQLHAPEIAVSMSVDSPDLTADGDPERVHQVVANLLENAVRHTPRGGVVEVRAARARATASPSRSLDEGPGIPEADADAHLRTLLPRRRRTRVDATAAPGSASRSRNGSSTSTAATSTPRRREPHGCRMVVTLPDN